MMEPTAQLVAVPMADLQQLITSAASPWMSIDKAAAYCDVSRDSIEKAITSGKLTAHRLVKGRVLIDRRELDSVIRSSTATPRTGRGRGVKIGNRDVTSIATAGVQIRQSKQGT